MMNNPRYSIETLMVTVLLIIFSIIIAVLIFRGSSSYQNTISSKETDENIRIALSFIDMKIKQNDIANRISVDEYDEFGKVLTIAYGGEEDGLYSYIYHKGGALYECYTDMPLDHSLSGKVVDVDDISMALSDELLTITVTSKGKSLTKKSAIRSIYEVVYGEE